MTARTMSRKVRREADMLVFWGSWPKPDLGGAQGLWRTARASAGWLSVFSP